MNDHDEDEITLKLIADEPEFIASMFAALVELHIGSAPNASGSIHGIARDCYNLRESFRRDRDFNRWQEGQSMRAHYANAARDAA